MKYLKPEEVIRENWSGSNLPEVSICCATYNHEANIEETILGFLNQQTNFPYEILIHDDASTDNTAKIIRYYEKNYPNIIKGIYQTENQFSQGRLINPNFNFNRAKSKYIAWCDGDDLWTNNSKLQFQKDFLDENKEFALIGHNMIQDNLSEDKKDKLQVLDKSINIFSKKELMKGQSYFPTSSLMFRNILQFPKSISKINTSLDHIVCALLGEYGKGILFGDKIYGRYRKGNGIWQGANDIDRIHALNSVYHWLYNYFQEDELKNYYKRLFLSRFRNNNTFLRRLKNKLLLFFKKS